MAVTAKPDRTNTDRETSNRFLFVLVVANLAIYTLRIVNRGSLFEGDIYRMIQLGQEHGTPYRDYQVEFAPIEFLLIKLLTGQTYAMVALRVGIASMAGLLLTAGGLAYGWGRRASAWFLALALPLGPFMVLRLDPLLIALVVWGFALDRRGKARSGGALIALGILAKIWPVVLVPALVLRRRFQTLTWLSIYLLLGGGLWILVGGLHAPVEVATFRGATGWEFESTVGVLVWALTGQRPFDQSGTARVGLATGWEKGLLLVTLLAILVLVWRKARGRDGDLLGAPALAVVGSLLFLSPLFSLQYALWLAPWAAVSWWESTERTPPRLAGVACLLTGLLWIIYQRGSYAALVQALILIRNSLCGLLLVSFLSRAEAPTGGRPVPGEQTRTHRRAGKLSNPGTGSVKA